MARKRRRQGKARVERPLPTSVSSKSVKSSDVTSWKTPATVIAELDKVHDCPNSQAESRFAASSEIRLRRSESLAFVSCMAAVLAAIAAVAGTAASWTQGRASVQSVQAALLPVFESRVQEFDPTTGSVAIRLENAGTVAMEVCPYVLVMRETVKSGCQIGVDCHDVFPKVSKGLPLILKFSLDLLKSPESSGLGLLVMTRYKVPITDEVSFDHQGFVFHAQSAQWLPASMATISRWRRAADSDSRLRVFLNPISNSESLSAAMEPIVGRKTPLQ